MKLPGEVWLVFRIVDSKLIQNSNLPPQEIAGQIILVLSNAIPLIDLQGDDSEVDERQGLLNQLGLLAPADFLYQSICS